MRQKKLREPQQKLRAVVRAQIAADHPPSLQEIRVMRLPEVQQAQISQAMPVSLWEIRMFREAQASQTERTAQDLFSQYTRLLAYRFREHPGLRVTTAEKLPLRMHSPEMLFITADMWESILAEAE